MNNSATKSASSEVKCENIFQNINEWLNDENNVITYRWLSLTLGIHVNYAKQALELFVNAERIKGRSLSVTYCLTGVTAVNGVPGYHVVIVKEENRKSAESTFNPPVSSHIYSIQAGSLKNSDILYLTDVDVIKSAGYNSNQHSSIQCQNVKLRNTGKSKSVAVVNGNESSGKSTLQQNGAGVKQLETVQQTSGKSAAVASNSKVIAETSKLNEKSLPTAVPVTKSNSGFNRLFAGAVGKQKTPPTGLGESNSNIVQEPQVDRKTENKDASNNTKRTSSATVASTSTAAAAAKNGATKAKATSAMTIKKSSDIAKDGEKKNIPESSKAGAAKRRRIVVESSSSSEDEDMVPPSPPPMEQPDAPTSPLPEQRLSPVTDKLQNASDVSSQGMSLGIGAVQRKLVSKTYINDEGFMVTEKVWESEPIQNTVAGGDSKPASSMAKVADASTAKTSSTTTSVATPPTADTGIPKKQQKSASSGGGKTEKKGKVAPPAGKKQASLTNFFQKK